MPDPKIPINEVKVVKVPQTEPVIPPVEVKVFKKAPVGTRGRKLFDGRDEEEVLSKIKLSWQNGMNDVKTYEFAQISESTYYRYLDEHPELYKLREGLRASLIMKSLNTVAGNLDDVSTAKWYLEKRLPEDFAPTNKNENLNLNLNKDVDDMNPEDAMTLANIIKKQYHAEPIQNDSPDGKQSPRLPAQPVRPEASH